MGELVMLRAVHSPQDVIVASLPENSGRTGEVESRALSRGRHCGFFTGKLGRGKTLACRNWR